MADAAGAGAEHQLTTPPPAAGLTRQQLQVLEEARLAPYAMRSGLATRRHPVDPEGRVFDFRTEFQRDRDRIVHSRAFRRLRQKTQVYLPDRDDHLRNRLIHTLEVAGIARTLARALSLNEDLAEAAALGHDLGHCAFGHSGEGVLNEILTGHGRLEGLDPSVAARCGGFKHNNQSLRVVDLLEKRYRHHQGLNLTDPVREAILKHTALRPDVRYPDLVEEGLHLGEPPFFETQVVALADEIAQQAHDLEDGIHDGAVTLEEVEGLAVVREVAAKMGDSYPAPGRFLRTGQIARGIVHLLVTSVATHSAAGLAAWAEEERLGGHDDFLARRQRIPPGLIRFAPPVRELYGALKKFVYRRIINSFAVNRSDEKARRLLTDLFTAYHRNPRLLEDHVLLRFKEASGVRFLRDCSPSRVEQDLETHYRSNPIFLRVLADHLASMTDTYALREHRRLHDAPSRA